MDERTESLLQPQVAMPDPDVSSRMREDWNARAREDAGYYVAFGARDQDDAAFFATATETVNSLETELRRVPAKLRTQWKALEIGCGPGRLLRPMSRHFRDLRRRRFGRDGRAGERKTARRSERCIRRSATERNSPASRTSPRLHLLLRSLSSTSRAAKSCSNTWAKYSAS